MNKGLALLKNTLICLLIFFVGLLIPTSLEFFNILNLDLEIYPWIIILVAALIFAYENVKVVDKMGLFVGLASGISILFLAIIILSFFVDFQLISVVEWKTFTLIGVTGLWGAIIINR